jgi:hypothetical protein
MTPTMIGRGSIAPWDRPDDPGRPQAEAMMRLLVVLGLAALSAACVTGLDVPTAAVASRSPDQATTSSPRPPGLVYAEKACSACDAVASGLTRSPDPKAPTFQSIANTPGMTGMALNVWLHSSQHRDMPYVSVQEDKLEVLSEHLRSLKD